MTDHDTCAGAKLASGRSLRAVEMSCDEPKTDRAIYVLCAYDRGGAHWGEGSRSRLASVRRSCSAIACA